MGSRMEKPGRGPKPRRHPDKRLDFPGQRCKTPVQAIDITGGACLWQVVRGGRLAAIFPHESLPERRTQGPTSDRLPGKAGPASDP
jgi:hypothetical protein